MKSLVIGIAGGTGSGKTTVTNKILEHLDTNRVVVIQHDFYYKDISAHGGKKPDEVNFDHPISLETDLLIRHIKDLKEGKGVEIPIYNFTTYKRMDTTHRVEPRDRLPAGFAPRGPEVDDHDLATIFRQVEIRAGAVARAGQEQEENQGG